MEALRQHVQHEAADELRRRQRHGLVAVGAFDAIVLVLEGDAVLVDGDQAAVGDGDAVGVARQIGQHSLGPGERSLGVDVPLGVVERLEPRFERTPVGELGVRAEELQVAGLVRGLQHRQHLAAEELRQHRHGQQIVLRAADPPRSIERDAAAGHDHVHVRVMCHRAAPRVQHRCEADPDAEPLRVGCDRQQRLRRGLEQEIVDHRLVLEGDCRDARRQREHDVEVGHLQQLGLARLQPLSRLAALALRAVPVAAANGRRPLAALWADPVMGSWRRLDRALVSVAANPAHHYEARLRSAISLSDGWNAPRRRCGGTIDSMASSFSVGSPRV